MTDKKKKRVREHAEKHGMSYQAAWNLLEGNTTPGPLEFWKWVEMVNERKVGLTIADVRAMEPGQRVQLLVMDRNLCDHVYPGRDGEAPKPTLPAAEFFERDRDGAVYIHEGDLRGRVEWGWDDERKYIDEPFLFELEFKEGHWHPLDEDGTLPGAGDVFHVECDGEKIPQKHWDGLPETRKHWTEFPGTTRVGWRGPTLRWEDLSKLPGVFTAIDVDRMVARAAATWIPDAMGISRDRISLRRREGRWVLSVEDLTDDEREQLDARVKGTEVIDRAELRRRIEVEIPGIYG